MRLIERLRWWAAECDRTNFGCQARGMLLEAADALEKAEPVKHGRWVYDFNLDEQNFYRCSVCDRQEILLEKEDIYEYCPYCHCGAKMDGDAK